MSEFPNSTFNNYSRGGVARLLVVDADTSVGDMIRDNFSGEGYQVECCLTGDETYNIDLSQYKVILLDLSIDDNSGLGLVEQIKQIYDPGEVAVIAYSIKMSPETIIQALNAGADDYLIKPFPRAESPCEVGTTPPLTPPGEHPRQPALRHRRAARLRPSSFFANQSERHKNSDFKQAATL